MFALPEKISHAEAPALAAALARAWPVGEKNLTVDASALREFDSSALALLLQLQRQAQAAGGKATVAHAPAKLWELARIYGVQEVLPAMAAG